MNKSIFLHLHPKNKQEKRADDGLCVLDLLTRPASDVPLNGFIGMSDVREGMMRCIWHQEKIS